MPKATTPVAERQGRRHNPLDADIVGGSGILRSGKSGRKSKSKPEKDEDHFVNSKQSAKILQLGRELADEDDEDKSSAAPEKSAFDIDSRFAPEGEDDTNDAFDDDEAWGEEEEDIELDEAEIAPEDLAMFNKFLSADDEDPLLKHGWDMKPGAANEPQQGGTNLADLIMEKIQMFESGEGDGQEMGGMDDYPEEDLPPKVIEVYAKYVTPHMILLVKENMLNNLQVRDDSEQMEERAFAETYQNPTDCPGLGENNRSRTARQLDTQRYLRNYQNIHIIETGSRTALVGNGCAATSEGRHLREQEAQCSLIQRAEEELVQTFRFLQGRRLRFDWRRYLHATRSSHRVFCHGAGLHPGTALGCWTEGTVRSGCAASITGRISRQHEHIHQDVARQGTCPPLPGRRCLGLLLFTIQIDRPCFRQGGRGHEQAIREQDWTPAACLVAPVSVEFRTEIPQ